MEKMINILPTVLILTLMFPFFLWAGTTGHRISEMNYEQIAEVISDGLRSSEEIGLREIGMKDCLLKASFDDNGTVWEMRFPLQYLIAGESRIEEKDLIVMSVGKNVVYSFHDKSGTDEMNVDFAMFRSTDSGSLLKLKSAFDRAAELCAAKRDFLIRRFRSGDRNLIMVEIPDKKLLISGNCLSGSGQLICRAAEVLEKVTTINMPEHGGANPGAIICKQSAKGEVIIATDEKRNEYSFCMFDDDSMVSNASLHSIAIDNDLRKINQGVK